MTGDIRPEQLGRTHCHEHVLFRPVIDRGGDLRRIDPAGARAELASFRASGGSGLVDATVVELGRDPEALAEASRATGVHIVMATGHTAREWWDGALALDRASVGQLAEEMVADLTEGIGSTSVTAGVIKVGTSLDEMDPAEIRIIEAAASAHASTGAPITTHTTAGTLGIDQLRLLSHHGVSSDRICIGHLDRRMVLADHAAIAEAGAYVGYDQISKQRHAPDRRRAEMIAQLVTAGYGDRILLGCDLARQSDLASQGGPGLTHLLDRFVPLLAEFVTDGDIQRMLVDNPRRFLTWS